MATKIRARLGLDASAPAAARAALRRLESELPRETFNDLQLLVSELVTNSYRHAGARPGETAVLCVDVERGCIHVDVEDPGPGFVPHVRQGIPIERSSGWGLSLVDRIARRWGVTHNHGTHVWFELERRAG